jgi:hypothetical protein
VLYKKNKIMKTTIATPEFDINGFSATHIIFDDSNYATIWAKCRVANVLQDVHLMIGFDKLNDLMRFSGANGEKIVLSMVDEMMHKTTPPYKIALKDIIGSDVAFTSVRLQVSTVKLTTMPANTVCLYVQEIWPINIIQQAKNLAQHTHDFKNIRIVSDAVIQTSMLQLKEQYGFYLGLLELDITDASCRAKANLSDDRLFAMAKSSWEKY